MNRRIRSAYFVGALRRVLRYLFFITCLFGPGTVRADPPSLLKLRKPKPTRLELISAPMTAFKSVPQKGHTGLIRTLAFSNDGRFILTGALDGTARLWDAHSHLLIRVFDVEGSVAQVAFVPDDKRVVTHNEQGQLAVFDMRTGVRLRTITTKRSYFTRIRPFSDGRRILVSNENTDIRVIDIDSGQTLSQFNECPNDKYPRTNVDLSKDNRLVITSCVAGTIQLRDLSTGKHVATYEPTIKAEHGTAFLDDGQHAVLFYTRGVDWETKNNRIVIWDYKNNKVVATHKHDRDLMDFSLSKDGNSIAILIDASLSIGEVEIRDLWTFKRREHFKTGIGNNAGVLRFSPDNRTLTAPGDLSSVAIFDLTTKQRIKSLSTEDAGGVRRLAQRPNRWQVASASGDGNVYLFDVASASLQKTLDANVEYITALDYSPDGRFVATVDLTNPKTFKDSAFMGARIWNVATGEQLYKNVEARALVRAAYFTPDGEQLFLGDRKRILVKDTKTWRTVSTLAHDGDPYSIDLSKDKNTVAISSDSLDDGFFDLRTGKRIAPFPMPRTQYAYYVPTDNRMLFVSDLGEIELWDTSRKTRIRAYATYNANQEHVVYGTVALSQDGTRFVGVSRSHTLDVWDVESGNLLASERLPSDGYAQAYFLPAPDYVAVADPRGQLQVWNLKTKAEMSFVADGDDWLVYTSDGYFDGSRRGGRLVAAVNGLSSFRIDQTATRNNRPDIILKRMGLGSNEIISHYESLYRRRVQKMGLKAEELDVTFTNAPAVAISSVSSTNGTASVAFEVRDDNADLARYNVYVNDVPIFGATGKPLSGRYQRITETIQLSSGDNKIEIGVLNRHGLESMRPYVSVANPEKKPSDLYYLAFGVSSFQNASLNLKYAAKDATDLANTLAKSQGSFRHVHVKVYTDETVSLQSIREAKAFLAQAQVDDSVVLFVAGHGLYVPNSAQNYFFLTHQTDLNRIEDTAVPFELLEGLLQGISPRKKLFLLDTCYSGESGDPSNLEQFTLGNARGLVSRGIRRKVLDGTAISRVQDSFTDRNRFIDNDLFRRSGAIVLSSSRGSELSYEKDELENGLFTEYVLRALSTPIADLNRDHRLSSDELREFVSKSVSSATGRLQNPVVDRDNLEMQFSLPLR